MYERKVKQCIRANLVLQTHLLKRKKYFKSLIYLFTLRNWKKEEQIKLKASIRQELIQVREQNNKRQMNKTKSWLFERIENFNN